MPAAAKSTPQADARKRLLILACCVLGWLALIGARLMWVQVYRYSDFMAKAEKQQQKTFEVAPKRGIIYDRNGNALAMTVDVDSVFAVPIEMTAEAKANTAQVLARLLKLDVRELQQR